MMETATAGGEAPALTLARALPRLSRRADDRASGLAPAATAPGYEIRRDRRGDRAPLPFRAGVGARCVLAIGRPRLTRLGYFAATRAFGRSSAAPGSAPSTSTTSSSPAPGRPSASPSTDICSATTSRPYCRSGIQRRRGPGPTLLHRVRQQSRPQPSWRTGVTRGS